MAYRLGVDLGTTFTSAVLLREHAAPEVFALGERSAAVPTVLYIGADGTVLYGEAAESRALTEPGRVVRGFKRRIGDEVAMVVATDAEGLVEHHAHDLAAAMIAWVVATVVAAQGGEAPDAIAVTHPATWGPHKTELLRSALAPHGLANLTLVSEPEAAAYTYAYAGRLRSGDTLMVYDLGGGTFDAAVLHADDDGRFAFLGRPLGLGDIGGIDFDDAIFAHVLGALTPELRAGLGIDERTGDVAEWAATAMAQLRADCTAAKEALSTQTATTVPVVVDGKVTPIRITRAEFETMIVSLLLPTLSVLDHCADAADIETKDVTAVLLAGGSSRIPLITQMLSAHLGAGVDVARDVDPKMAVAAGAVLAITAVAPEAHAAAGQAGPSAVTGLARARARADKAAARTKVPAPAPAAESGGAGSGKAARLKDATARAVPLSRNSTPQATPLTAAATGAIPGPAAPSEPVAIPRGITTEAGKVAYERVAAARLAREAEADALAQAARVATLGNDDIEYAVEEELARIAAEIEAASGGAQAAEAAPARSRKRFGRKAAATPAATADTDDADLDLYVRAMPVVSGEEQAPAPAAQAQAAPVAPPAAPAKYSETFLQPKGRGKAGPAKSAPPAPKPSAARPAAKAATPAPEIGTGRPIRARRNADRTGLVAADVPAADMLGDVLGLDPVGVGGPGVEPGLAPAARVAVAPRPVGGLADLLGTDPEEAWAPAPKAAVAVAEAEPARPTVRQAFFADGELVESAAEGDGEAVKAGWHSVLTVRRVFSTRRILTVASLTAALFIGSGTAAVSPVQRQAEPKAASHVTKVAR